MKYSLSTSFLIATSVVGLSACGDPTPAPSERVLKAHEPGGTVAFPIIDDNLQHDTLLVQVTFDLGAGKYMMVASNVEEQFEGLRLYRYSLSEDGMPRMEAISAPGYDSWTLLPTFFEDPHSETGHVILANMGERNSWGQKVMRLNEDFSDLGFLDVALPERVQESDTSYLRLKNIAPVVHCERDGEGLLFSFRCDSLYLYDDLMGQLDIVVPSSWVEYEWDATDGMMLRYRGERRRKSDPAI